MPMSVPGQPEGYSLPAEDSVFELVIDTLEGLDRPARGLFVQRLLKSLTQLELSEQQSLETWDSIITRRQELSQILGRPVALKTAMMDVLASSNMLRAPILMEYEELKKLQVNAAMDPLTGLYNRRLFEEYFEKELNRARRYDLSLALIVLDLHVFKEVNDQYGHPRGDLVLQLAASTLRHSMRTSDFAFRIGGDEFALLLPQSDAEQAGTLGRRVHTNFAAALTPQKMSIPLGLDYGVAIYPQDGDEAEVMLRVADERLYQMKYSARARNGEASAVPSRAPNLPPQGGPAAPQVPPAAPSDAGTNRPVSRGPETPPETKASVSGTGPRSDQATKPIVSGSQASAKPFGTDRRRSDRISLAGTRAFATVGSASDKPLRVLDMSHGGVALEAEENFPLTEAFQAVLQVPILGEVRVRLRKLYVLRTGGVQARIGCTFIT